MADGFACNNVFGIVRCPEFSFAAQAPDEMLSGIYNKSLDSGEKAFSCRGSFGAGGGSMMLQKRCTEL